MSDATRTIWKTVVFAGAMLGASACGPKASTATTPANTGGSEMGTDDGTGGDTYGGMDPCAGEGDDPCAGAWEDPCAGDPCEGRIRGGDDEGGFGRGFLLS
ncbi:MAG: hypothetical protein H6709_17895 [Kofleriaceae bacterium]|nr:hypothetical protein [Myxococcales bacterium]MCB9564722.1 hypothetical protein [Kofleriaceae bacterium]MCB9573957.1 hypothetical protein [Kofleriaceae bacterium]